MSEIRYFAGKERKQDYVIGNYHREIILNTKTFVYYNVNTEKIIFKQDQNIDRM